jgi:hypothetical protein
MLPPTEVFEGFRISAAAFRGTLPLQAKACKGKVQFRETSTCGVQEKCTLLDRRDFDFASARHDDDVG